MIARDNQESIHQYYENIYYRKIERKNDIRRIRNNLKGMDIKKGSKIIDVGCGTGEVCECLIKQGINAIGIDISLQAVKVASKFVNASKIIQANAEYLPFVELSFDGAVLMGSLEHFINPHIALKELKRVLKPKAQICFLVPNCNFFLFKFFGGTGQIYEKPRTFSGWYQLFNQYNFKVKQVYRDVGPSVFKGNIIYGILRRILLLIFNLLPLNFTYQFVFICQRA